MKTYRAALIGCSRMGAFIDNEVPGDRPFSHAAGYEACARTELIACSDVREDVMARAGERYGIPPERQYLDYGEMLERERPDIVSVATQPEQRAEIVIRAAESGARAIYAEKAMAASMAEAEAMVRTVEAHGVAFNLGTNRRWDTGYEKMKEVIDSGRLGALKSLIVHQTSALFNGASHSFDLLLWLNSDAPVRWVQAHLPDGDQVVDGDILTEDPTGHGILQFDNGVIGYALNSGRGMEVEAVCEQGVATALDNGECWRLREPGNPDHRGRPVLTDGEFPAYEPTSSTQNLIEDLVRALDTGDSPRGGVRAAFAGQELIFAFIESHRRGGARVALPLGDSRLRLHRQREPRQPRYEP